MTPRITACISPTHGTCAYRDIGFIACNGSPKLSLAGRRRAKTTACNRCVKYPGIRSAYADIVCLRVRTKDVVTALSCAIGLCRLVKAFKGDNHSTGTSLRGREINHKIMSACSGRD